MNIIGRFARKVRKVGFNGALQQGIYKLTGAKKCSEEIDALYYYLNKFVDITKVAPADGALRRMQLCDAALIRIFDAVCEREGWDYWLAYGTLLGAKRHGGFIPWDDDQDVCMPRKDYDDAIKRLPEIFASFGEDSVNCHILNAERIGLGYQHSKTGIWCDIFPCDMINVPSDDADTMKSIRGKAKKYRDFYSKKGRKLSLDELAKVRDESVIYTNGGGGIELAIHALEFSPQPFICRKDLIFPLSTIQYEGFTHKVPNRTHEYLTGRYGDYMQFPRDGILHHNEGRGPLSSWAERNNIDMDEVLEKLREIDRFFRS